jgi:hypothetical protein
MNVRSVIGVRSPVRRSCYARATNAVRAWVISHVKHSSAQLIARCRVHLFVTDYIRDSHLEHMVFRTQKVWVEPDSIRRYSDRTEAADGTHDSKQVMQPVCSINEGPATTAKRGKQQ